MSDIAQLRVGLRQEIFRIVRGVAFGLHEKIVKDTPIDTGRAKASWRLNPDIADETVEPLYASKTNFSTGAVIQSAQGGEQALTGEQAEAVARAQQQKIGAEAPVIVISNALDYIEGLEHGNSKQAPAGMVLKNATEDELNLLVDQAIANNRT